MAPGSDSCFQACVFPHRRYFNAGPSQEATSEHHSPGASSQEQEGTLRGRELICLTSFSSTGQVDTGDLRKFGRGVPDLAQWVKDLAWSLLWCRWLLWLTFDPWPRNFCLLQVQPKGEGGEGGEEEEEEEEEGH